MTKRFIKIDDLQIFDSLISDEILEGELAAVIGPIASVVTTRTKGRSVTVFGDVATLSRISCTPSSSTTVSNLVALAPVDMPVSEGGGEYVVVARPRW